MIYLISFFVLFGLAVVILMSRGLLVRVGRWVLHRRYDVSLSGVENLVPKRTYLVLPNHPALVDPFILATELYRFNVVIRPLIDESFFSSWLFKHIFMLFDAVRVPDFRHINFRPILKIHPLRRDSVKRARGLGETALSTLASGGSVLLYPSGHITANGKEEMSNRQLAFNILSKLPENVVVIGVRMRGLYGSMWSRVGGRPSPRFIRTFVKAIFMWFGTFFRSRRKVSIHFEEITDLARGWISKGRQAFNGHLEKWYDADLAAANLLSEPAS